MGPRAPIALASLAAAVALAGCGGDDEQSAAVEQPPSGGEVIATVEGVEDGEITGEDLEREVVAAAAAEGRSAPAPESPEFDLVAGDALDRLVLSLWIAGEAARAGRRGLRGGREAVRRADGRGVGRRSSRRPGASGPSAKPSW